MAAVAGPLDHRCSSTVSVDIDPDWYEGQPETADEGAAEQAGSPAQPDAEAHAQAQAASAGGSQPSAQQQSTAAVPAPAPSTAGSHVPTVLTKLQKWGDYASFGEPVAPTRFIPMKTPLSHELLDNWQLPESPKHRLTVQTLLEAQHAAGRRVGLLLDLANHDCLYDTDIPSDVEYLHVQLVAKELPPLEFVREVGRAANNFWARHPDQYIAIHCAYGFNRTGFVVCSYLIEHCGLTVDEALQSFAASRPPGVKHEKFRQELRARYGSSGSSSSSSSATSGGGGGSVATAPLPVPAGQPSYTGSVSSSIIPGVSAGAGLAASPAGPLSCRSCGSNSSSTAAAGWPAGGSPEVASPEGRLPGSSPGMPSQLPPAGAGNTPRCCCCNAELLPENAAAALATGSPSQHAAAAAAAGAAQASQRSIPCAFSSSSVSMDEASCSTSSCFAAASSGTAAWPGGVACSTPPPLYPLPPALPHSGSRGALLLSSSPASRLTHRCWSSNSVGDNSSIGCSPTSSTADLITLRTSGVNSARSSGLDSSSGGAALDVAAGGGAEAGDGAGERSGRGSGMLLSQQWLGCAAAAPAGPMGGSSRQRRAGGDSSGSGEYSAAVGGLFSGRFSAGGCSSSGAEGACGQEDAQDDPGEGSGAEEGCFEMDPYTDPPAAAQQEPEQQQQRQGSFSSRAEPLGRGRRKSVTFQEAACCEQAAPGCGAAVQQLRGADLDSLLASVSISPQQAMQQHQQPQQVQLPLSPPLPPAAQLQPRQGPLADAAAQCSCDCHNQLSSPPAHGSKLSAGYSIRDGDAGFGGSSSSRQLDGELPGSSEACLQRGYHSSEDGVFDPLENESFGKVTSADLLKNLRALQRKYEAN